jgi:DNA-binding NtrC family response regulator
MKKNSTKSPQNEQENELLVGAGNDILVVDDDKVVLDFIKMHLADEGYNIVLAEDGIKAIKCLRERFFNLVLVDKNLPDINGLDLLVTIKKEYPQTKVIIMTAYGSTDVQKEANLRGSLYYVEKPFEISDLCRIEEPVHMFPQSIDSGLPIMTEIASDPLKDSQTIMEAMR